MIHNSHNLHVSTSETPPPPLLGPRPLPLFSSQGVVGFTLARVFIGVMPPAPPVKGRLLSFPRPDGPWRRLLLDLPRPWTIHHNVKVVVDVVDLKSNCLLGTHARHARCSTHGIEPTTPSFLSSSSALHLTPDSRVSGLKCLINL